VRRGLTIVVGVLTGVLAAGHLLFALANFGLAKDDEAVFSVPLGEGIVSLVAALALAVATLLLCRRRVFAASLAALSGTLPLPVFFAFTVPEHSGWVFLFASLVIPGMSAIAALAARRS